MAEKIFIADKFTLDLVKMNTDEIKLAVVNATDVFEGTPLIASTSVSAGAGMPSYGAVYGEGELLTISGKGIMNGFLLFGTLNKDYDIHLMIEVDGNTIINRSLNDMIPYLKDVRQDAIITLPTTINFNSSLIVKFGTNARNTVHFTAQYTLF